jgi:glycosyltransferase involved in cell wall biosynthesis
LARFATVDLVVDGYQLSTPRIRDRFRVLNPEDFLKCHAQYTAAIYHIANDFHVHAYMIPCMRKVPGIMVLHDCCLEYPALGLTLRQGDFRSLRRILRETYGNDTTALATKLLLDVPAAGPLRRRYGFEPDHFIVASANSLSHTKRLNLVLEAVAGVREHFPQIRLLIIGGGSPGAEARALIGKLQLDPVIRETGYVSNEDYRNLVNLSDVAVDLRYPSGGDVGEPVARICPGETGDRERPGIVPEPSR